MSVQNVQTSSKVPTQCERIRQYIKDFGSITTYEAVMDIGVLRLGARISEMRKRGEKIRASASTLETDISRECRLCAISWRM